MTSVVLTETSAAGAILLGGDAGSDGDAWMQTCAAFFGNDRLGEVRRSDELLSLACSNLDAVTCRELPFPSHCVSSSSCDDQTKKRQRSLHDDDLDRQLLAVQLELKKRGLEVSADDETNMTSDDVDEWTRAAAPPFAESLLHRVKMEMDLLRSTAHRFIDGCSEVKKLAPLNAPSLTTAADGGIKSSTPLEFDIANAAMSRCETAKRLVRKDIPAVLDAVASAAAIINNK